jgi:hypothetical protein
MEKFGQLEFSKLMEQTNTKYDELKEIVNELLDVKDGVCHLKNYKGS